MPIKDTLKEFIPPIVLKFKKSRSQSVASRVNIPVASGEETLAKKSATVKGIFMHIHKCAGTSLIDAFELAPEIIC